MTCQRSGCSNPTKGPRARFCSGACKVAHHRKKPKLKGSVVQWSGKKIAADPALPGCAHGCGLPAHHDGTCAHKECGQVHAPDACPRKVHETPCPPDCEAGPPESHIHVSMPGFAMAKPEKKGILASSGAPSTFKNELTGSGSLPTMAEAQERVQKALDRSHAPGCPCWTCKGIPAKKTKKP